jgi:hypothetical protein
VFFLYSFEKSYFFHELDQLFHISFIMSICNRFLPFPCNAIKCVLWWNLLRRSIAGWVLCPWLQNGWLWYIQCVSGLWQPARVWSSFWCLCSLCGVVCTLLWLWSSFPIFLVVLVHVFLLSRLSSPVGDMFRYSEFLHSLLLLLRRRLLRFHVPTWFGTHSNVIFVDAWSISFRIN